MDTFLGGMLFHLVMNIEVFTGCGSASVCSDMAPAASSKSAKLLRIFLRYASRRGSGRQIPVVLFIRRLSTLSTVGA